jgi:dTDP-glucose 4,6-dehydratase
MKTVLVTGGMGFIGSCFIRQLIPTDNYGVVNYDSLTYAANPAAVKSVQDNPRYAFVQGDVADPVLVMGTLRQYRPNYLVHFAAETHVDRSIADAAPFLRTNVIGTYNLLDSVYRYWQTLSWDERDEFRFVLISTDEVYGSLGDLGVFTEFTQYAPNSSYAASKAAADHFTRAYLRTYGLPTLTTHCSNNYGPWQHVEKLIPRAATQLMAEKPMTLVGTGQNVRDWIHVSDHCRAIQAVMEGGRPGRVYNIGGDTELTNQQVIEAIADYLDEIKPPKTVKSRRDLIVFAPDRMGNDFRYALDASRTQRELGWKTTIEWITGLRETVDWYLGAAK